MERTAKVALIGDLKVGKTNILARYVDNEFDNFDLFLKYDNILEKKFEIDNKTLIMQLWDTAGAEKYFPLSSSFYLSFLENCHGIILCYSVTDKKSFETIVNWMNALSPDVRKDLQIVLVANKIDLESERVITLEQGFLIRIRIR